MHTKKQVILTAFILAARKVVQAAADADDGGGFPGYFTPYIPGGAEGDDGGRATMTEQEDTPTPTDYPLPETTDGSDFTEEPSTVPTSTRTSARPSNTPDGRRYTPVTETLSDGTSYQKGSFNSSLKWQSTGILQHGAPSLPLLR